MVDSIKVDRLILQAGIDAQKAREAMTGLAGMNRAAEQVAAGFQRFSNAARGMPQSIRPTLESLARLKSQARSAAEDVADLREELLRADAVDITVKTQQQTSGLRAARAAGPSGAFLSAIGGVTGAGTLADAGRILTSVNNIRALGEQVQDLGLKARNVVTAGGLAGVALAAMTIAIDSFTQQTQKAASQLSGAITGAQDVIRIVSTGTADDVRKAITDAQTSLNVLRAQRDLNQRVIDEWGRQFGVAAGAIEALVPAAGPIRDAHTAIAEFDKQIAQNETVVNNLTAALEANATAARDAVAALEEQARDVTDSTEEGLQRRARIRQLARTASSENIQQQIADAEDEIAVIRSTWRELSQSAYGQTAAFEELRQKWEDRLTDLEKEKRALEDVALPAAKAREAAEAAKKAEEELAKTRLSLAQDLIDTTQKLTAAQATEAKRRADVARQAERDSIVKGYEARIEAAKATERAAEQERELVDARTEAVAAIQELDTGYMAESLKALQDYQREESRLREDYNTEQRRAAEDLYADLSDLAAQRDVAGFIRRQREGERDIQRRGEDFGVEAGRRAADFVRAQAERRAEYEQERAQRQAQAQERIAQIRAEGQAQKTESERLQQELSDLRARWAEEDKARENAERAAAAAEQINLLRVHQSQVKNEIAASYRGQLLEVRNFAQGVINLWNQVKAQLQVQAFAQRVSQTATGIAQFIGQFTSAAQAAQRGAVTVRAGGGGVSRYATGVDYVPSDRWAFLHQGEEVRSAAAARRGGRNASVTFVDNRTVQVGDIASKRMVEDAIAADRREMMAGLQMAVWGSY